MKRSRGMAAAVFLASAFPAVAQDAGAVTDVEIEPQGYTGGWYEIARTSTPFQQQCDGGVTAQYDLLDEATMRVVNRCDMADGTTLSVSGEAEVVDGNFNTFDVDLSDENDAPEINYVIAAASDLVDGQYQWAAVFSAHDRTGWILSRSAQLDADARAEAEAALEEVGVDISELSETAQPPQTYRLGDPD